MRSSRWLTPAAAALLGLAVLTAPASACPNCKQAVAAQADDPSAPGDGPTRAMVGWNRSILLMMGMPFLLLGTGALMVARAVKRGALPEL